MKDSRFIELLNLYVDHRISDADAAVLETEIQHNPARRQIYRQYCRMQKACATLAENFRTEAPDHADAGKVVEFTPRRRSFVRSAYAVGTLAAAACVAVVVLTTRHADRGGSIATPNTGGSGAHLAVLPVQPVSAPASRSELKPVFIATPRTGELANANVAERNALDWMKRMQLPRVTTDDIWFQTPPARLQHTDLKLRQNPDDQDTTELSVAIRFQR